MRLGGWRRWKGRFVGFRSERCPLGRASQFYRTEHASRMWSIHCSASLMSMRQRFCLLPSFYLSPSRSPDRQLPYHSYFSLRSTLLIHFCFDCFTRLPGVTTHQGLRETSRRTPFHALFPYSNAQSDRRIGSQVERSRFQGQSDEYVSGEFE